LGLTLAVLSLVLLGSGRATGQTVVVTTPRVSYYYSPPVVTDYSAPPVVSYYYAPPAVAYPPTVSYYTPSVSYSAPAVSYAVPVVAVPAGAYVGATVRYGLFGRPRVVTYYYR
jgi:hypothetical protein